MNLFENTLYINLDYRTDRLENIHKEFEKMGIINFERFPAIKMKMGNVGCTLSHIKCIELAKARGWPHVFICEDDISFKNPKVLKKSIENFTESNWDVLVIGGNNCPPFIPISEYYVKVMNVQTTTGYIIKNHYYDILLANFKEGLDCLIREPEKKKQYSLDIYWKTLQQRDRWFMLIPLTVVQYYDYSDIEEKVVDYSQLMLDLDKRELMERFMRENQRKDFFSMKL